MYFKNNENLSPSASSNEKQPDIIFPPGSDPASIGIPYAGIYNSQPSQASSAATETYATPQKSLHRFLTEQTGKFICLSLPPEYNSGKVIGMLTEVGDNYLLLQEFPSQNMFLCDINSIKFLHIYENFLPSAGEKRTLFGI